jgi:hypothetical protein
MNFPGRFAAVFHEDCRGGLANVRSSLAKVGLIAGAFGCLLGSSVSTAQVSGSTKELVAAMLTHEDYEAAHRGHYMYLCKEWSDRTAGHLWTEKVVETTAGKVRMLVAEDGQPLSGKHLRGREGPVSRYCGASGCVSRAGADAQE